MSRLSLPTRAFSSFLFDMDGTLLNSNLVVERAWKIWAKRHGVEVETFLPTVHGVQAVDVIRRLGLPGIDPEAEAERLLRSEMSETEGIVAISGAEAFLNALPPDRWAIVTSAPRILGLRRMNAAGLPIPRVLIAAEDVERGKPAPDGFLCAAARLNRRIGDCLVFEDAPAGIQAAQAAGTSVVVVTATHELGIVPELPNIPNYSGILTRATWDGDFVLAVPNSAVSLE